MPLVSFLVIFFPIHLPVFLGVTDGWRFTPQMISLPRIGFIWRTSSVRRLVCGAATS